MLCLLFLRSFSRCVLTGIHATQAILVHKMFIAIVCLIAGTARVAFPQNATTLTDSQINLALDLKEELQSGAILNAQLHAIQLQMVLDGTLTPRVTASIANTVSLPNPDKTIRP